MSDPYGTLLGAMREFAEKGESRAVRDPQTLMKLAADHVAEYDRLIARVRSLEAELADLRALRDAVRLIGRCMKDGGQP